MSNNRAYKIKLERYKNKGNLTILNKLLESRKPETSKKALVSRVTAALGCHTLVAHALVGERLGFDNELLNSIYALENFYNCEVEF